MTPSVVQTLADSLVLGELLESLRRRCGGYEVVDHWQQGEFHHDIVLRVPEAGGLRCPFLVVATNCNGGVKEVLSLGAPPSRSALWHWRCPDVKDFSGPPPSILDRAITHHWFDPCELLAVDARSELRTEFRERDVGGGWKMASRMCGVPRGTDSRTASTIAITDFMEDGFFRDSGQFQGELIDDNRFHHVAIDGLPLDVQFARIRVTVSSQESTEHLLIGAAHALLAPETIDKIGRALARLSPADSLSFFVRWETERSTLIHRGNRSFVSIAAAAAAWMCAASWDESDPIIVTVNSQRIAASMEFDFSKGQWKATLTTPPPE